MCLPVMSFFLGFSGSLGFNSMSPNFAIFRGQGRLTLQRTCPQCLRPQTARTAGRGGVGWDGAGQGGVGRHGAGQCGVGRGEAGRCGVGRGGVGWDAAGVVWGRAVWGGVGWDRWGRAVWGGTGWCGAGWHGVGGRAGWGGMGQGGESTPLLSQPAAHPSPDLVHEGLHHSHWSNPDLVAQNMHQGLLCSHKRWPNPHSRTPYFKACQAPLVLRWETTWEH